MRFTVAYTHCIWLTILILLVRRSDSTAQLRNFEVRCDSGARLTGHTLQVLEKIKSKSRCLTRCFDHPKCQSINYFSGRKECHLMNASTASSVEITGETDLVYCWSAEGEDWKITDPKQLEPTPTLPDVFVRLVNGLVPYAGRVEVFHGGNWSTVCGHDWDMKDGDVACRQLGYPDARRVWGQARFGEGTGPVSQLSCEGSEETLLDCPRSDSGVNCAHSEDSSLECTNYIRLVNGPIVNAGRVEVYHDGRWGTVCDDSWDLNDAEVACHQLGYDGAKQARTKAFYGQGNGPILLDDLKCTGNEESLHQCRHNGWGNENCGHSEDAGMECFFIRLVNTSLPFEGRVEVLFDGQWSTICDHDWDLKVGSIACRDLGSPRAQTVWGQAHYGEGTGPISQLSCDGSEETLLDCPRSDYVNCTHSEDSSLECSDVRLTNGPGPHAGRIEVYDSDRWGTVCDDSWDINDATVCCRQLGFPDAILARGFSYYGQGSLSILLDEVKCGGSEDRLRHCRHDGWGNHDCATTEKAGVDCAYIRLMDGPGPDAGRIEVYHNDQWGSVCDDGWDIKDADVACRALGYHSASRAWGGAHYGQGTVPIVWSGLSCTGSEVSLYKCPHAGWGGHNCSHSQDSSLECFQFRLSDGPISRSGRLEVYHDGQWGTVCDDYWDTRSGDVVCHEMGYPNATQVRGGAYYGQGTGPIHLAGFSCTDSQLKIYQCPRADWGEHNCSHNQDAGLECSNVVRLADGDDHAEGRVELFYDGQWGTVGSSYWDLREANIICRQLGYPSAAERMLGAHFGPGVGPVFMDTLLCTGSEKSLWRCNRRGWGYQSSNHDYDASVRCQV